MALKLNGSSSGSVALDAPASTTSGADITFKLPVADGTAGQVLKTDGSGNLSWVTPASIWTQTAEVDVSGSWKYDWDAAFPATFKKLEVVVTGLNVANGNVGFIVGYGANNYWTSGYDSVGTYAHGSATGIVSGTSAWYVYPGTDMDFIFTVTPMDPTNDDKYIATHVGKADTSSRVGSGRLATGSNGNVINTIRMYSTTGSGNQFTAGTACLRYLD